MSSEESATTPPDRISLETLRNILKIHEEMQTINRQLGIIVCGAQGQDNQNEVRVAGAMVMSLLSMATSGERGVRELENNKMGADRNTIGWALQTLEAQEETIAPEIGKLREALGIKNKTYDPPEEIKKRIASIPPGEFAVRV